MKHFLTLIKSEPMIWVVKMYFYFLLITIVGTSKRGNKSIHQSTIFISFLLSSQKPIHLTKQTFHRRIIIQPISRFRDLRWFQKPDLVIIMQSAHTHPCLFRNLIDCFHPTPPMIFLKTSYTLTERKSQQKNTARKVIHRTVSWLFRAVPISLLIFYTPCGQTL